MRVSVRRTLKVVSEFSDSERDPARSGGWPHGCDSLAVRNFSKWRGRYFDPSAERATPTQFLLGSIMTALVALACLAFAISQIRSWFSNETAILFAGAVPLAAKLQANDDPKNVVDGVIYDALHQHHGLRMRTTLAIDDDILAVSKHLAERDRRSIGEVVSDLARQDFINPGQARPA